MRKKQQQTKTPAQTKEQAQSETNLIEGNDFFFDNGLSGSSDDFFDDDFFTTVPEGTRIFIEGNTVTFENMTPDLEDVAHSLNPSQREGEKKRRKTRKKTDKS